MPYNNLTLWKPQSPTGNDEPAAATDARRCGRPGYPEPANDLMALWRDAVPVDFVFWDQVGSRPWVRDYNKSEPDPIRYLTDGCLVAGLRATGSDDRGWVGPPRRRGHRLLRQPAYRDHVIQLERAEIRHGKQCNRDPHFALDLLLHDKVLLYQHNLEQKITTQITEVITWNLAWCRSLRRRDARRFPLSDD